MAIVTKLEDFNLLDMLQLVSMGNRSALIRVQNPNGGDTLLSFCHGYLNGILPCDYKMDDDYKEFLSNSLSHLLKGEMEEYNLNTELIKVLPEQYLLNVSKAIKNKFFELLTLPQNTEAEIVFRNDWNSVPLCIYHNLKSINLMLDSCKHMANKDEISKILNENSILEHTDKSNITMDLDPMEKSVLANTNGINSLKQIAAQLNVDLWETIKTAYNLNRIGALHVISGVEHSDNAEQSGQLSPLEELFSSLTSNMEKALTTPIADFTPALCQNINELSKLYSDEFGFSLETVFKKAGKGYQELEFIEVKDKAINYKDFIDNLSFFTQDASFSKNIRIGLYTVIEELYNILLGKTSDSYRENIRNKLAQIKESLNNLQ